MPVTRQFFVGTDCGIAVSNDNGATWSHFVLSDTSSAPDSVPHRVRSLLVINRGAGVAAADRGLFRLHSSGVWIPAAIRPNPGPTPPVHSFAAPWFASDKIFFLAHGQRGQKIFGTSDGGETWERIRQPDSVENREAFVRISKSPDGNVNAFDAYMGDGQNLYRHKFRLSFSRSPVWTKTSIDHLDPSDVAFDATEFKKPLLLASDGGVHRTTDNGLHWKLTGGGFGGFTALQINEITGQTVTGTKPHLDLYYSTQDNDIKASSNGGQTWDAGDGGGEGRHIRTVPTSVDHQGTRVTWWQSAKPGDPHFYVAAPHFQSQHVWPSAPDGPERIALETPFLIVEDVYLQPTRDTTVSPTTFPYFLTQSAGQSWRSVFTLMNKPQGPPAFAGFLANPTVYQGVFTPGFVPGGGDHFGLMRVRNLATTAAVSRADSAGMGAFGSLRTPIGRYVVFGVDPRNANHLLAPDVINKQMKFSADGGSIWFFHPALTQAVTDSGKFIFNIGEESLASVIAWDPYHPCTVLVGTAQNGVVQSRDGGRTFKRIAGSEKATHISSFFFPPTGVIWMSTSGRGLWTLDIDRNTGDDANRCPFPDPPPGGLPPDTLRDLDPVGGAGHIFRGPQDSSVCPKCSVALVKNGWVTGIQQTGDTIRELAISGGTLFQIDGTGKEVPLTVPNVYRDGDGRFRDRAFARGLSPDRLIRALVLEGRVLRGVIVSRDELPFAPARTPLVYALAARNSGDPSGVPSGERIRISGRGFLPSTGSAQPLQIRFDNEVVAPRVPVRADGTFSIDLPMDRPRGEVVIWVEQRDGLRVTRERMSIEVRGAS